MERFPIKTVAVALNGTTYAELVAAPPFGVAYRIKNIYGQNNAGGARILELAFNENTTRTPVWFSASTADAAMFNVTTSLVDLNIALTNTDESLDMRIDNTGTDRIVCTYEIEEL